MSAAETLAATAMRSRMKLDEARETLIKGMRERDLGDWIQKSKILDDVARVVAAEEVTVQAEHRAHAAHVEAQAAEIASRWEAFAAEYRAADDDVRRTIAGRIAAEVEREARWSLDRAGDLAHRLALFWPEVDRLTPDARLAIVAAIYAAAHDRLTRSKP